MLKNYLKMAFRMAARHKGYAAINLLGLAVGMACFSIILLYVQDERSYDQFHRDADRIYRVVMDQVDPDVSHATVPPALMPAIQRAMPDVEHAVRLFLWEHVLSYGDTAFKGRCLTTDSTFFEVFSFSFVRGTAESALRTPSSVVLTARLATTYFGDEDPLGKTLTFQSWSGPEALQVSGVIEDVPSQSHFSFDFVTSTERLPFVNRLPDVWRLGDLNTYTYVKLSPGADVSAVNAKIQSLVDANTPENTATYFIQPLAGLNGIHLSSHRTRELQPNSDFLYIKILLLIAVFVILIAGINYVNLATARSATRAKEIGVRKVVGAPRASLVRQFLAESLLLSVLAGLFALVLTEAALPFFNTLMQKQLSLFRPVSQPIWGLMAAVILAVGLIAGLYPALYLSAFKPIAVLKHGQASARTRVGFRQGLVVFQFGLSALLIVGLVVVQKQLRYIQDANLGFDKDQVIMINAGQLPNEDRGSVFRHALAGVSGVLNVGAGNEMGTISGGWRERMRTPTSEEDLFFTGMEVDHHYLDVLGIDVIEGRNFSPAFPADSAYLGSIILNETAVKHLGLHGPVVGQQIIVGSDPHTVKSTIIGVVKDFHFSSFHHSIDAFGFVWWDRASHVVVKVAGGDVQETLRHMQDVWAQHAPGMPFDYYFLDTAIERQYQSEQNFRAIFSAMTGLSLVIACLGLLGLAAFTAERRTKEIGIRKVLGASVTHVVALLSKDFVKLVVVANFVAWPLAYVAMKQWLATFAYHVEMGVLTFVAAGVLALVIAVLTVSWQSIRAAMANPVESLRYE